jgi:hypothetical protein
VLLSHPFEMEREASLDRRRQHRRPILAAFAVADRDLVGHEVDVLDPETTALEEPETGAIEESHHQPRNTVEVTEDGAHILSRRDDRQVLRALGADQIIEPWQFGFGASVSTVSRRRRSFA